MHAANVDELRAHLHNALLIWRGIALFFAFLTVIAISFFAWALFALATDSNNNAEGLLDAIIAGGYLGVIAAPTLAWAYRALEKNRKIVLAGSSLSLAQRAAKRAPWNSVQGIAVTLPLLILFIPAAAIFYYVASGAQKVLADPLASRLFAGP